MHDNKIRVFAPVGITSIWPYNNAHSPPFYHRFPVNSVAISSSQNDFPLDI